MDWNNTGDDLGVNAWVNEVGWLLTFNFLPSGNDGLGLVEDWDGVVVWDGSWSDGGAGDWHFRLFKVSKKINYNKQNIMGI